MFRALLIAAAVAAASPATAKVPLPTGASEATAAIADTFFTKVKNGQVADAYNGIFAGTLMEKKRAESEQAVMATETALKLYGPVTGWSLIKEEAATPNLVKRTYEMRTDSVPLFWDVYFYRNTKGWQVININFNDQAVAQFD